MPNEKEIEEFSKYFQALMHHFHHIAGQVSRLGDFSLAQYRVLMALAHRGPITVKTLKQVLGNAQSSVSEMILRLEEQGLVARKKDQHDRRQTILTLTPRARRMLELRKQRMNEVYLRLLQNKSPEEVKELIQILRRLKELFDANENENHSNKEGL